MRVAKNVRPEDLGIGRLFERVQDAVIVAEAKTQRIVLWNPAATHLFGYSTSEALTLRVEALVPEYLKARHRAGIARYAKTGHGPYIDSHELLELPAATKGGEEIHIELSLSPIGPVDEADGDDNERFMLAIIRNITQRKRAEEALRESEERYRTVVEQALAGIFLVDLGTKRILEANAEYQRLLGYASEEIVGLTLYDVVAHDRRSIDLYIERVLEAEKHVIGERQHRRKDGSLVDVVASASRISYSGREAISVIVHDVTERKRIEEMLRESEDRYRRLVELSPDAVAVHSEGKFLYVNDAGAKLLGAVEAEELIGKPVLDFVHPDYVELVKARVRRTREEGDPTELAEIKMVRLDREIIDVETRGMPIHYGGTPATQVVIRDITERKRAEEEMQEVNRRLSEVATLRADFTAMIAHEIGSPLAAIRAFLEMLATGELDPDAEAEALDTIRTETNRLSTLVADVSSAGAIERDDVALIPRRTSAGELLEDAARFARTMPGGHPLTVEVTTEERVWADSYRIGQVLRNLLSNAAKYSPPGAPIELRAKPQQGGHHVRIEVADHGHGVHHDDVTRIFEKFGRGRDQSGHKVAGVGLGLYLSRRILQAHGSELELESRPGEGSVFGFELEVAQS